MAKNIIHATALSKQASGTATTNYIRCTVEMPASEFAAFRAIGDLTDVIPTAEAAFAATAADTGPVQ